MRKRYTRLVSFVAAMAAALAVFTPSPASAQLAAALQLEWHTLPNGLSVCLLDFDTPGVVSYWTVVRAGSRNEVEPGRTGYAHLFEHLMFRGTETFPKKAYNDEMARMGADHNAFTETDWTVYTASIPTSQLPRMIEIQADRFQNLSYTEEAHVQETGAVLGEFNIGRSDPKAMLSEKLFDTAFDVHTYKHSVIGWEDDVRSMPQGYEYGRRFFDLYYRPNNCAIFVVGDFEPSNTLSEIIKYYQRWKKGPETPVPRAEPPQTAARRDSMSWSGPANPRIMMGFRIPAFDPAKTEPEAMEVLRELAFGPTSPLYREWVDETRRAYAIEAEVPRSVDPSLFTVGAELRDVADVETFRGAVLATARAMAEAPPDEEAVENAKSYLTNTLLAGLETPGRLAYALAQIYSITGQARDIHKYLHFLAAVDPDDVQRAAATYLIESNSTTVTLRSGEGSR